MRAPLRSTRRRVRSCALAAALAALAAWPAAAQLLAPVVDDRYAHVENCPTFEPCQSQSARPPGSFAAFDAEVSIGDTSASQQSSWSSAAGEASLGGSLAADKPSEPGLSNTLGDAVFDLTFDATAAATYSWSGEGTVSGAGYGGAILYDQTSDTVLFERSLPASFANSGVLTEGHRYQVLVHATVVGRGSADWSFELTALPEPGFALAIATGFALAILLARRRA